MSTSPVESLLDEDEIPALPTGVPTVDDSPAVENSVAEAVAVTAPVVVHTTAVAPIAVRDNTAIVLAEHVLRTAGYRILAPFIGGARTYNSGLLHDEFTLKRVAAIIDVETTGDNPQVDEIVQLAIQLVVFDEDTKTILHVSEPRSWMEEPTRTMHPDAVAVHGITPEMVRGLPRIDAQEISAALTGVHVLIAHNAAFDAPVFLRRFPMFDARPWACSLNDIPWRAMGYESARLGALLQDHTQHHFHGHDAGRDVAATAHVLATPFADGSSPLGVMLENALTPRVRVIANGAPFDAKDLLKARGYAWNDSSKPGARLRGVKAWWTECKADELPAEREWLARHVYNSVFADGIPIRVVPIDPATRFLS